MARLLLIIMSFFLLSCGAKKKITHTKEVIVESIIIESKDTTVVVPGVKVDTTLLVADIIPTDSTEERETVFRKKGITAKIKVKGGKMDLSIESDSSAVKIGGYQQTIKQVTTTKDTIIKAKEPHHLSIFVAFGIAVFVAFIFWLIYKFL